MRVLALDTTTRAGSVALVVDGSIADERRGDESRSHAERLPGDILALLDAHQLTLRDIDLFAVASGPGSFTGLRIGIATIQGCAIASSRPAIGIPALDAIAQLASRDMPAGACVAAWMDARRRDVFSALYRVTDPNDGTRLVPVEPATVGEPAAILEGWRDRGREAIHVFGGDGAVLYGDAIAQSFATARVAPAPLLAGVIGQLAAARVRGGDKGDPAAIQPVYVRRPDAVIERERRARGPRPDAIEQER